MAPPQTQPQHQPSRIGTTVTVACKFPAGVILRLFKETKKSEPVLGGGFRDFMQWDPDTDVEPITIQGPTGFAYGLGSPPGGPIVTPDGFALTPGVPKDFWDAWRAQNKDSDLVKRGLLLARESDVEGAARENAKQATGLEPTDPENPAARLGRTPFTVKKDDGK